MCLSINFIKIIAFFTIELRFSNKISDCNGIIMERLNSLKKRNCLIKLRIEKENQLFVKLKMEKLLLV